LAVDKVLSQQDNEQPIPEEDGLEESSQSSNIEDIESPTIEEDYNGNGDPTDDDLNANNIPDFLDVEVPVIVVVANPPTPLEVCDEVPNDEMASFDLTTKDAEILDTQTGFEVTYHEIQTDATAGTNPIANPIAYINIANPQTIYPRVTDPVSQNFDTTTLELRVNASPEINTVLDFILIDENNDGYEIFDLTTRIPEILGAQNPNDFEVYFYESLADAQNDVNRIVPATSYINSTNPQTIYVRIINSSTSCFSLNQFIIYAEPNLGTNTSEELTIVYYPNPTTGIINFKGNFKTDVFFVLYTIQGQVLISKMITPKNNTIMTDLSNLSKGVYFIKLSSSEVLQSFRVVKN